MNNYTIEFLNLDNCFQYESFMAEDQYEAVDIFKNDYPKCKPYSVFMEVYGWQDRETEEEQEDKLATWVKQVNKDIRENLA